MEKTLDKFPKSGKNDEETPEQPYIVTTFLNKLSEQQRNDEE